MTGAEVVTKSKDLMIRYQDLMGTIFRCLNDDMEIDSKEEQTILFRLRDLKDEVNGMERLIGGAA